MSRSTRDDARSLAAAQAACSVLLGYPDDGLAELLPAVRAVVAELPEDTGAPLAAFLSHLDEVGTGSLGRHYVAVFDMKRRCCPYLTYWTHGDTRNRGAALVRFKQVYRASGAVPRDDELPDHLSVVLDFAATVDADAGNELLAEHRPGIELIRDALRTQESPYRHVLDAVVATLAPMTDEIMQRAAALAASGPPTELVGIGPAPSTLQPFSSVQSDDLQGARR